MYCIGMKEWMALSDSALFILLVFTVLAVGYQVLSSRFLALRKMMV